MALSCLARFVRGRIQPPCVLRVTPPPPSPSRGCLRLFFVFRVRCVSAFGGLTCVGFVCSSEALNEKSRHGMEEQRKAVQELQVTCLPCLCFRRLLFSRSKPVDLVM